MLIRIPDLVESALFAGHISEMVVKGAAQDVPSRTRMVGQQATTTTTYNYYGSDFTAKMIGCYIESVIIGKSLR